MHRSIASLKKKKSGEVDADAQKGRQVANWSEGCQVHRDPDNFFYLVRLAQLSKRALCGKRGEECRKPLAVEHVKANANVENFDSGLFSDGGARAFKPADNAAAVRDELKSFAGAPSADADLVTKVSASKRAATLEPEIKKAMAAPPLGRSGGASADAAFTGATKKAICERAAASLDPTAMAATDGEADAKKRAKQIEALIAPEIESAMTEFKTYVGEKTAAWIEANRPKFHEKKRAEFSDDLAEPCDFLACPTACSVSFDYILVELPEAQMKEIVGKLKDYSWSKLFPGE